MARVALAFKPGEAARLVTFVADDYAHVGLPAFGYPACTRTAADTCLLEAIGPERRCRSGNIVGTFTAPAEVTTATA